jgi:acetoin utilization deacetylase AcuC-like enzyme
MIASYACDFCGGRYFAVLEGGYNQRVLGENVKAMLRGLDHKNHQLI